MTTRLVGPLKAGTSIHPTAIVDQAAELEGDVEIGPYSIIHTGVRIGRGSKIGAFCELGIPTDLAAEKGLHVGPGAVIRSHTVFYDGSRFGQDLRTGHHVTAREDVRVGDGVQIGSRTELDRGCTLGNYVRLHSNVMTCERLTVHDFALIFPNVVLANDAAPPSGHLEPVTVGRFAVIAVGAKVLPGATIGEGALIGAQALVRGEVPADVMVVGVPAEVVCDVRQIRLKHGGKPTYPWRRHFHRGYPADVVAEWRREFPQG